MKCLHTLAIPLLVIASTPALAADMPASQNPPERTGPQLEQHANSASAAASHEAARAAQVEQHKQAIVDTLKASASSDPGEVLQDPAIKPSPTVGERLTNQAAKIAELLARQQAGDKLGDEQSEAMRELLKKRVHAGETRLETLELNWLDLPHYGMSEEEARAAGYPCIGPDDAPVVAEVQNHASAPGDTSNAATEAMIRTAVVAHRMATFAAPKHKEHHAMLLPAGQACDDCPDCADGTCTQGAHIGTKTEDFDCVDCPDQQVGLAARA